MKFATYKAGENSPAFTITTKKYKKEISKILLQKIYKYYKLIT